MSRPFLAETLQGGHTLFRQHESEGQLRIKPNGAVDVHGFRGPWSRFLVEAVEAADAHGAVRIRSFGHQQRGNTLFLTAAPASDGTLNDFGSSEQPQSFLIVSVTDDDASMPHASPLQPTTVPAVALTEEQRASFVSDGFLILRNIIPRERVDDALRAINAQLGLGAVAWEAGPDGQNRLGGGIQRSPAIVGLLHASPALCIAQQLLGGNGGAGAVRGGASGQVALRFPLPPANVDRAAKTEEQWHIDGMKVNSHMSPFQLLLGVALSSQPADDCGNLHVWPKMHGHLHEAVQRQRAIRASLVAGVPHSHAPDDVWLGQRPRLENNAALQVQLEPGDVVLAHQKLPHRIGLNRSPHVRYQVYFRLSHMLCEPTRTWSNRPLLTA